LSFVIQGGGYDVVNNALTAIPLNRDYVGNPLNSEAGVTNARVRLAWPFRPVPIPAPNEWFFNEVDNSAALDGTVDGGPFTVFGVVANANSLAIMDALANVPVPERVRFMPVPPADQNPDHYTFGRIPLLGYTLGAQVLLSNLVNVNSITRLTVQTLLHGKPRNSRRRNWLFRASLLPAQLH